ncbi:MAG: hypothetical protein H6623_08925 [Bdellovibrionaceae bacterium]|nr:hypothetical protein [Pseudobdellovibrionaceae bacterium]
MTRDELRGQIDFIVNVSRFPSGIHYLFQLHEEQRITGTLPPAGFDIDERYAKLNEVQRHIDYFQRIAGEFFGYTGVSLSAPTEETPYSEVENYFSKLHDEISKIHRLLEDKYQQFNPSPHLTSIVKLWSDNSSEFVYLMRSSDDKWRLESEDKSKFSIIKNDDALLIKAIFQAYLEDKEEREVLKNYKDIFIAARKASAISALSKILQGDYNAANTLFDRVRKSKECWLESRETPFTHVSQNERLLTFHPKAISWKSTSAIPALQN